MKQLRLVIAGFALLSVGLAHASVAFLEIAKSSPKLSMGLTPAKIGVLNHKILEDKLDACRQSRSRQGIFKALTVAKTFPIQMGNDDPRKFLENKEIITDIEWLDKNFRSGEIAVQPWSGDYWAIRYGATAKRYNDSEFPIRTDGGWLDAYNYFLANPSSAVDVALLAPSEKYDRVVADPNYSLTKASWQEGKKYHDEKGEVESWMGLCHGWAPASFMEPRPEHSVEVEVLGVQNKKIKFTPHDLKAMFTLKWANGLNVTADLSEMATRFLGGRCDVKDPKKDEETGRIIDPQCFDLNPASWHIALTHQIARDKTPLIIDAAFDYEVWNQPVTKFSYKYFNPKDLVPTDDLSLAAVSLNDPEFNDRFKKFRKNESTKKLVGVIMTITYLAETSPHGLDEDSMAYDRLVSVDYYYDLEIDEHNQILDGEWYQNQHPDFIWGPKKNSIVINQEDLYVGGASDAVKVAPMASENSVPLNFVLDIMKKNF